MRRRRFSPLYLIIPVVYLAVILGLVYAQFSQQAPLGETVGPWTVTGRSSRAGGYVGVSVTMGGLTIPFSGLQRAQTLEGETRQALELQAYVATEIALELRFRGGLSMILTQADSGAPLLQVVPVPGTPEFLVVPLAPDDFRPVLGNDGVRAGEFVLEVPEGTTIDSERRALVVPARVPLRVVFGPNVSAPVPRSDSLLSQLGPARSTTQLSTMARALVDSIYQRLQQRLPDLVGGASFDDAAAVLLAEAVPRAEYATIGALVANQLQRRRAVTGQATPQALTTLVGFAGLTAPWEPPPGAILLAGRALSGDSSVMMEVGLVARVAATVPSALPAIWQTARDALASAPTTLEPAIMIGALSTAAEVGQYPASAVPRLELQAVIGPASKRMQEGLAVQAGVLTLRGASGPAQIIAAAQALEAAADLLGDAEMEELAAHLLAAGLLGAQTLTDPGELARVYHLLVGWEQGPRWAALPGVGADPPAHFLTLARLASLDSDGTSWTIGLGMEIGSTHHVVISGVADPPRIQMHDVVWRPDPNFQAYSDGWRYHSDSQSILLKITHRQQIEPIQIGR